MSDDLHDIDRLFKNALESEEESPPNHVWENIDQQLDKAKVISLTKKYATLKRVAVALLAFAFALGMYALQITYVHKQATSASKKTGDSVIATEHQKVQNNTGSSIPDATADTANIVVEENPDTTKTVVSTVINQKAIPSADTIPVTTDEVVTAKNNKSSIPAIIANSIPRHIYTSETNDDLLISPKQIKNQDYQAGSGDRNSSKTTSFDASTKPVPEPAQKMLIRANDYNTLFQPSFKAVAPIADVVKSVKNGKQLPEKQHFSLGILFLPELAINRITSNEPFSPRDRFRDEFERKEQYSSIITTGIIGSYHLSEKWSVTSGLLYSSSTINIAPKTIYAQHDREGRVRYRYNCSSGYLYIDPKQGNTPAVGDSIEALASKSTLQYVDVPVVVTYGIAKGRFSFSPSLGLSANFLTKGKMETALDNNPAPEKTSVTTINGLRPSYFSGWASFGVEYKITNTLNIGLAPTTRFALTSINKDGLVESYPKSLGVAASVRIGL